MAEQKKSQNFCFHSSQAQALPLFKNLLIIIVQRIFKLRLNTNNQ